MRGGPRAIHLERVSPHKWSARIRHPITGRQLRITDESEAKIRVRIDQIRGIKSDYRLGVIGPREAEREISLKLHGAPMVYDLWLSYEALLHGQHAVNTKGLWKVRLAPWFGKSRVYELTPEVMARWEKDQLRKGCAPKTIQNAFWSLKTAIRAAVPHRVDEIPWGKWRPRPRPSGDEEQDRECVRSLPELGSLLRAAKEYDAVVSGNKGYSDAAIRILFLILTGCRQSEAAAMGWDCIELDHQPWPQMWIRYASRSGWRKLKPDWTRPLDAPKMNKRRAQNLHPAVVSVLKGHKERLERVGWYRPDGPVFPGHNGAWRSNATVMGNEVFREIVKLSGLPNPEKWVVHSTRHSFGTLEAQAAILAGDAKGFLDRGGWTKMDTAFNYMKRAGRGRPMPYIGELAQGDLPGLVLAGPAELKMLEARKERDAMVLAELSEVHVVPERTVEKSLTIGELAVIFRDDKDLPKEVQARGMARYRRAYNEKKRAGATTGECEAAGNEALRGFRNGFRGMQKKARQRAAETIEVESTKEEQTHDCDEETSPSGGQALGEA